MKYKRFTHIKDGRTFHFHFGYVIDTYGNRWVGRVWSEFDIIGRIAAQTNLIDLSDQSKDFACERLIDIVKHNRIQSKNAVRICKKCKKHVRITTKNHRCKSI